MGKLDTFTINAANNPGKYNDGYGLYYLYVAPLRHQVLGPANRN